jgi:uncharacterized protein
MRRMRIALALPLVALLVGMTALAPAAETSIAQARPAAIGKYFDQTGQAVGGAFWQYWNATGGLNRHGYPVSPEMNERNSADGKTYVVQYFERTQLEYRPDKRILHNTQVTNVGTWLYGQRYGRTGATGQQPNTTRGSILVRATNKRIGGKFLEYYNKNGGAAQLGNPISDEFNERSVLDNKTYKVQYFERAVLQFHPDKRAPWDVTPLQAGQFRYENLYAKKNGSRTDTDSDRIPNTDSQGNKVDFCPNYPENINKVFDTDGCPDTMQTLMIFAAQDLDTFWTEVFKESGVRYRPPADFLPYTRPVQTACGPAVLNNAFYCPRAHGIYYDYNFLQDQLNDDGDFAPVTILAHEWGHLVQGNLNLLTGQFYTIQTELQADCFAGAWAKHAADRGLLEEGDLEEGANSLFKAGDDIDLPWFDPGAHGQPEQRVEAFTIGFEQGVDGCTLEER